MKKELNMKFKERFPKLEITFTKLRSIKRELQRIAINECHLDLLTLSQSFVYLEQLVLKNRITKINRKYCAGACLILAGKLNDVKGQSLTHLIEVSKAQFLSFKISSQIFSHQRNWKQKSWAILHNFNSWMITFTDYKHKKPFGKIGIQESKFCKVALWWETIWEEI